MRAVVWDGACQRSAPTPSCTASSAACSDNLLVSKPPHSVQRELREQSQCDQEDQHISEGRFGGVASGVEAATEDGDGSTSSNKESSCSGGVVQGHEKLG